MFERKAFLFMIEHGNAKKIQRMKYEPKIIILSSQNAGEYRILKNIRRECSGYRRSAFSCILFFVVLCLLLAFPGCYSKPEENTKGTYSFISPTFSPDNKKIILAFCDESRGYDACDIVTYDLSNGDVQRWKPTANRMHVAPIYSPDGTKIAFAGGDGDERNIFVMSSSGENSRQFTFRKKGANAKGEVKLDAVPTFSPDGERVIFKRSENKR